MLFYWKIQDARCRQFFMSYYRKESFDIWWLSNEIQSKQYHLEEVVYSSINYEKNNIKWIHLTVYLLSPEKVLKSTIRQCGIKTIKVKMMDQNMPEPRNFWKLRSLQGKLAYIRCFISTTAEREMFLWVGQAPKRHCKYWDVSFPSTYFSHHLFVILLLNSDLSPHLRKWRTRKSTFLFKSKFLCESNFSLTEKICLALTLLFLFQCAN